MAREHPPGVSDSGGARPAVAVLAALLVVASALAPASTVAAVAVGDGPSALAAAGNTDETTVGNDETTAVGGGNTTDGDDETTVGDDPTAANDDSVTIRGRVESADGDPAANDTMGLGATDRNRTDDRGRYRLRGEPNRSYDLTYRQDANRTAPRDGRPDAYAVGEVDASEDLTWTVTLPAAHPLNVTVAAENGTRVRNATVRVTHAREGANATLSGETDEQGRLVVGERFGVELAGNVTVAVEAPNASLLDATETLAVENATDERIVLPENDTEPPEIDYDAPSTVGVNESATFDASNSTDESGVAEVTWQFDDASVSGERVVHTFDAPGNHSVRLTVTDEQGNSDSATIEVEVEDTTPPDPELEVENATAETGEAVTFDASNSTDNHEIETYRWDFDGDDATERTTNESVTNYTYEEAGTYDARVTLADPTGNEANATREISVELPPPTATFTVSDASPDVGERVTFDANASEVAGNLTNVTWTFEGGTQVLDSRVVNYSFPDEGTYGVSLTVTDEQNRTDSRTRTVEVDNEPPRADAGENRTVVGGTELTLDGSNSTDSDDPLSFDWTQTAGPNVTVPNETGPNATLSNGTLTNASTAAPTFETPEVNETTEFRFELTVADDQNETDADSVTVRVAANASPNVSFDPDRPAVGERVTFRADGTGPFEWDFGAANATDGTNATDSGNETDSGNATVTHRFETAGDHEVSLTDGANRTVSRTVRVFAPPNASADAPANATAGERVALDGTATNASDEANTSYRWVQTAGPNATLSNATEPVASFVAPEVADAEELAFELRVSGPGGNDTAPVAVTVGPADDSSGAGGSAGGSGGTGSSGSSGGNAGGGSTGGSGSNAGESGGSTGSSGSSTGSSGSTGGVSGGSAGSDDSANSDGLPSDAENSDDRTEKSGTDPDSPSVTVRKVGESSDEAVASVESADADAPATVTFPEAFGGNESALETLSVEAAGPANFSLSVDADADRPEATPAPEAEAVLSYLRVEERNVTDDEIESARFEFRVPTAALDRREAGPEAVRLLRYHAGEWQTLATTPTGERDGFYRFEAVSPGFSTFAVGVGASASESGEGAATDDGAATTASESDATGDSEGDSAGSGGSPDSDGDSGNPGSSSGGGLGGLSGSAISLGLFCAALVSAALWGYLLS